MPQDFRTHSRIADQPCHRALHSAGTRCLVVPSVNLSTVNCECSVCYICSTPNERISYLNRVTIIQHKRTIIGQKWLTSAKDLEGTSLLPQTEDWKASGPWTATKSRASVFGFVVQCRCLYWLWREKWHSEMPTPISEIKQKKLRLWTKPDEQHLYCIVVEACLLLFGRKIHWTFRCDSEIPSMVKPHYTVCTPVL